MFTIILLFSEIDWSEDIQDVAVADFVEPVGPATILPPTVVDIFRLFFTSAIVATIVHETNAYARDIGGCGSREVDGCNS